MIKVAGAPISKVMLLPIMALSQLFGLTFVYGCGRKWMRMLHRLVMLSLLVVVFLHEVPSIVFWLRASKGLHRMLIKFETSSRWCLFFANYVLTTYYSGRVKAIIDDLVNNEFKLPDLVRVKVFRWHIFHILLNVSVIIAYDVLGHDYVWANPNHNSLTSTAYIFNDLMIMWSGFQFIHIANVIRELFKYINNKLEGYFSQSGSAAVDVIRNEVVRFRHLHLYLYNICRRVNTCFSMQLLLIIVFSVIQTVYALRAFISDVLASDMDDREKDALLNILWGFLYMFVVYQIIAIGDYTTFESKKSSVIVHRLINDHFQSKGLEKELELFSLQIHQHQAVFSIWLFDLRFTLLNTVIGLLTTCLIILITFQEEWKGGELSGWNMAMNG